jgi:hypothetical protein
MPFWGEFVSLDQSPTKSMVVWPGAHTIEERMTISVAPDDRRKCGFRFKFNLYYSE